jgi:uncharacterized phage-associated protein
MFNERKAAQIATWFLRQQGGRMPHLKLMKLMYLADRESLARFGFPLTGDKMVSMPHGPVLSLTLDHIDGHVASGPDGWEAWITDRENHEVAVRERASDDAVLDELSRDDFAVLAAVWNRFGSMSKWALRDYTHDHCAEWQDPDGSSKPIAYQDVFKALGRGAAEADRLAARIEEQARLDRALAAI